jgi:hypothetical protein
MEPTASHPLGTVRAWAAADHATRLEEVRRSSPYHGAVTRRAETSEAAQQVRAILAAVDRGELAVSPIGLQVVRRLEGAAVALEAVSSSPSRLSRGGGTRNQPGQRKSNA